MDPTPTDGAAALDALAPRVVTDPFLLHHHDRLSAAVADERRGTVEHDRLLLTPRPYADATTERDRHGTELGEVRHTSATRTRARWVGAIRRTVGIRPADRLAAWPRLSLTAE